MKSDQYRKRKEHRGKRKEHRGG